MDPIGEHPIDHPPTLPVDRGPHPGLIAGIATVLVLLAGLALFYVWSGSRAARTPGAADAPPSALRQLGGVTRVTEVDRLDGVVGYEVECETGQDLRREIARTVVTAGWGLLELRPIRASLEDIFLQLTTEEQSGEATIQ